jgi:hypothetical protein
VDDQNYSEISFVADSARVLERVGAVKHIVILANCYIKVRVEIQRWIKLDVAKSTISKGKLRHIWE